MATLLLLLPACQKAPATPAAEPVTAQAEVSPRAEEEPAAAAEEAPQPVAPASEPVQEVPTRAAEVEVQSGEVTLVPFRDSEVTVVLGSVLVVSYMENPSVGHQAYASVGDEGILAEVIADAPSEEPPPAPRSYVHVDRRSRHRACRTGQPYRRLGQARRVALDRPRGWRDHDHGGQELPRHHGEHQGLHRHGRPQAMITDL